MTSSGDFEHELVHEWIYRRLDGSLNAETRLHLDQHLERCAECRAFERQVSLLDRRLRVELPLLGVDRQTDGLVPAAWLAEQWQKRLHAQARLRSVGLMLAVVVMVVGLFGFLARPENRLPGPLPPSFNDLNSTQTAIAAWPTATLAATQTPRATPLPRSEGRLLYEASDNRSTDLYLTRADASGRMLLGPHPNSERAPHPSPDGQLVAFLSNRLNIGEFEIYVMNADGTGARLLTEMDSGRRGWTGEMAWSPDSRQLLAVFENPDSPATFQVERGDPADQSRHYDGQWEGQLYKIDLESGAVELLTAPSLLTWNPAWSPDGRRIYFNVLLDGYTRIFSILPDGSDLQSVGKPGGLMEQAGFTFSPDGASLAYLALRRTRGADRSDELRLLDLASGDERTAWTMTNTAEIDLPLAARFATTIWSPDGQRLIFAIPEPDGKAVLKMLDLSADPGEVAGPRVDGETVLFVGIDLYFPGHTPAWSLDSRSMAILLQRQVFIINANSDVDSTGGADLLEIYAGKRDEIGAGWLSWLP